VEDAAALAAGAVALRTVAEARSSTVAFFSRALRAKVNMRDDEDREVITERRMVGGRPTAPLPTPRWRLLVIGGAGSESFTLPVAGEAIVGRASNSAIFLDDASVSRRHARILVGPKLQVEDLGSANGTRVGNRKLTPGHAVLIAPGDTLMFGPVMATVQASFASTRLRHIWTHGYFEARVEEECVRAEASKKEFAIMRLRVGPGTAASEMENWFVEWLRPTDTVAAYSPREYEVLLVESTQGRAEQLATHIQQDMQQRGGGVTVGIACYPKDGRTPEVLVAKAGAFGEDIGTAQTRPSSLAEPGAMQRMEPLLRRVAASDISVLIQGETGAGKEVLANAIHALSPRVSKPFLGLNCAALSETLLESELFGYERGAFTGAVQAKPGLLHAAQGGTVFLDEIGEMPMAMQAKVLRVLEQREVLSVGGLKAKPIDVRILCATNRDLEAEIAAGRFRRDLYFRLNGISLVVPALRDRLEEIEPLALTFIGEFSKRAGRPQPALSTEAVAALRQYNWPGNVRELRNVMERAVLLCEGHVVTREHLPLEKMGRTLGPDPTALAAMLPPPVVPVEASTVPSGTQRAGRPTLLCEDEVGSRVPPPESGFAEPGRGSNDHDSERRRIAHALERCAGNQTQAAKLLGISRRTLVTRLQQYAMPRPRKLES
jgi:DNA-binding NtrC family response regulator